MAILTLRLNEDPILKKKCKEVTEVNDRIRQQLDDMMETLHAIDTGAALAANQVGLLRRLVVIDYEGYLLKLVNPKIIETSGEQECIEGCLSFPDVYGKTIRPQKVTFEALDENGKEIVLTVEDHMAKCVCHEFDHLDGEVFIDKVIEFLEF